MAKNKVYVRINGSEYTIIGEEAEDYLFLISRFLYKKIKETLTANPKHSNTSAAVLTALTITDDLFKLRKENAELKNVIKEPEDKLAILSNEFEDIKFEFAKLSKENENLKLQLEEGNEDKRVVQAAYNEVYENYVKKNEGYDELLAESLKLQEHNDELTLEIEALNEKLSELKSQLLEREIENVKINKEFKDFRGSYNKRINK
jgi:cell division protein ZapA